MQKDINKNLPLPKPRFETTKEVQPKQEEKIQKPGEKKDKEDIKNLDKKITSLFIFPKKKPVTYKVSAKEIKKLQKYLIKRILKKPKKLLIL